MTKASNSSDTRTPRLRRALSRRWRSGAVIVEYAFLLTAVAIPVMAGISAGGMAMYKNYQTARTTLMAPIP